MFLAGQVHQASGRNVLAPVPCKVWQHGAMPDALAGAQQVSALPGQFGFGSLFDLFARGVAIDKQHQ
jgi:hypothetical protein